MVHTPGISQRVHHATDEEKLASTGIINLTADSQEDPECTRALGKKLSAADLSNTGGRFQQSDTSNLQISLHFKL